MAAVKKGDTIFVVHRTMREFHGSDRPLTARLRVVSVGRYVTCEWPGVPYADKRGRVYFGPYLGPQVYPARAFDWGAYMDAYLDEADYRVQMAAKLEWDQLIQAMRRWPGAMPPAVRIRQARALLGI